MIVDTPRPIQITSVFKLMAVDSVTFRKYINLIPQSTSMRFYLLDP